MDVSLHSKSQTDVAQPQLGREEGFLHYIAREGRSALRWTLVLCMIAIIACMVSPGFYFVAVVPALILFVAFVLLVLVNEVEARSDVQAHEILERRETATVVDVVDDHAEDHQLQPVQAELVKREGRTIAIILAAVMIIATLIAGIFFNSTVVAIGAFVVFAYMLLVAAPLWLGWIEDDIEIETHRIEHLPPPAGVNSGEIF